VNRIYPSAVSNSASLIPTEIRNLIFINFRRALQYGKAMKTIIYSDELRNYDFGPGHPFRSDRFEFFLKFYKEVLTKNKEFKLMKNTRLASYQELELWHTKDYIEAIEASNNHNIYKYVSQDNINPITGNFPKNIARAAKSIVKNSILAFELVLQNETEKAVSIGGGLHHAMPSYGEGFCVYNDVVIAIKYVMKKYGLKKILLLDTDAHAGNGVCKAFYSDSRVLFIDIHQDGIYPGTGFIDEIGSGKGKGFTVNLPVMAGTGDKSYELIFDELIKPLAEAFEPEIIARYGGSDPHFKDTLASLGLTLNGFKMIAEKINKIGKLADNKTVDLICSGYNIEVLPKAWLALIAEMKFKEEPFKETNETIKNTKSLIEKVKNNLKPYWEIL